MRLLFLLQTAMPRNTMQTLNKLCLSKSSYTTGRNTSRMAIHHLKDVSILKTGICQGVEWIQIELTFSVERYYTLFCTLYSNKPIINVVFHNAGTFQNIMFTLHQCSFLLTGSMNTGIHLKWMTTGLSTWDPKAHGMTKLHSDYS